MKHLLSAGLVALGLMSASAALAQDTIRFAVTDIDGLETLQREMGPFKDAFEAASGLKVEFFPVSGRTVAVEAMAADQVDFVMTPGLAQCRAMRQVFGVAAAQLQRQRMLLRIELKVTGHIAMD